MSFVAWLLGQPLPAHPVIPPFVWLCCRFGNAETLPDCTLLLLCKSIERFTDVHGRVVNEIFA